MDKGQMLGDSIDWDHVKIFLAVAEQRSLSAAAPKLKISPPTIARHIARLEQIIEVKLFDHRHDGYFATEAGKELIATAQRMEDAAQEFCRQATALSEVASGRVRVASGFWFSRFITEYLPSFHKQFPEIDIELITGHAIANLDRGDADVSIRNMRPMEGDLVMRKLGEAPYAVYGSHKYVEENPASKSEARYDQCDWIVGSRSLAGLASQVWLYDKLKKEPILRCSQTLQFLDAAKSGLGLTLLPILVGEREATLQQVSDPISLDNNEIWLVVHEDLKKAPAVRAVIDWLVPLFRALK